MTMRFPSQKGQDPVKSYLRPLCQIGPSRPSQAVSLAGGWAWFSEVEILRRGSAPEIVAAEDLSPADLAPLTAPRAPLAGMDLERPRVMGIVNVTPDSFSDGGAYFRPDQAIARGRQARADGADILDIGGESTRPGATEVAPEDEIARTAPVIAALAAEGALISLDTRKSSVARAGLAAGAAIVNDVSGLRFDPDLAKTTARAGAGLVVMHSIGTPETMQAEAEGAYGDVLLDVYDDLARAVAEAEAAGVDRARIVVDPGIGFGKTDPHNLALLARVALFHGLGCAILLGVSRKGMIGRIANVSDPAKRDAGSAGIGLWALSQGVQILRVHDIEGHRQAVDLWWASQRGGPESPKP